jgi:hypothetical protein
MIGFSFMSSTRMRGILIAMTVTVTTTLIGSTGGAAQAQTSSAPALDSLQTNTMPAAPVGHRQPRRVQLPSNAQDEEHSELSSERGFDQQRLRPADADLLRLLAHGPARGRMSNSESRELSTDYSPFRILVRNHGRPSR